MATEAETRSPVAGLISGGQAEPCGERGREGILVAGWSPTKVTLPPSPDYLRWVMLFPPGSIPGAQPRSPSALYTRDL